MTERTIIIGGGLMGVATLYELAARGVPATLLEAQPTLAQGASYANGGMITASMSDPWNSPGVGKHLAASLFDPYAAMKLRPWALPGLALWGLKFLRNAAPSRYRRATLHCFELASRSAELLRKQITELDLDIDASFAGSMKVFESATKFNEARRMADDLAPLGLAYEAVPSAELSQKEPQLAQAASRFVGGIYFPNDGAGDARAYVEQLNKIAKTKGAEIELGRTVRRILVEGGKVTGVETNEGQLAGTRVVICLGYDAPRLVRGCGARLAIKPAKGYSVTVDARGWNARPRISVVDDAMHAAVSVIGERLRFVGTAEFAGADTRIQQPRIDNLVALFRRLYPHLGNQLDASEMTPWAGLRPMSADGLPYIGPAGLEGLWVNAGQGHLGWTMAAGSAELLADQMLGRAPKVDPGPFLPGR